MKVGIQAYFLNTQLGGTETYVRNIVGALGVVDPAGDYTLFLGAPLPPDAIPGAERMRRVVVNNPAIRLRIPFLPPSSALRELWVPSGANSLALARERIDVVHVQCAAPLLFPARIVVTVHDIAHEHYPQFFPRDYVMKMRVRVPLTVRRAAMVLTDSEFSKRDMVRRYRVDPDKVVVAPCAADPVFQPVCDAARLAEVRARYGTGDRFIIGVGDLQPRKNIKTLIAAYLRLRRADAIRHKLVLVGRKTWLYDDIFAAARTSGYEDDLVFTGYVPIEDLAALYSAAQVFAYPSLFEGFGLPPLEAMACGTPVITSNTTSLPEVVADAGLMVDPLDVEALARALAAVLGDADLRDKLTARGLERAASFSWQDSARIVRDVYHRAADSPAHKARRPLFADKACGRTKR